jgi:LytS/YehU family sensor histidine kinase
MKSVELYLNIQRLRFQDTLTVDIQIDPNTLEARVPHLILQPLVENAFRHGISKRVGAGVLKIYSEEALGIVKVCVSDNGPGASAQVPSDGIGLSNTRARLEKLYGGRAALNLNNSPAGFSVELQFPLTLASQAVATNGRSNRP